MYKKNTLNKHFKITLEKLIAGGQSGGDEGRGGEEDVSAS